MNRTELIAFVNANAWAMLPEAMQGIVATLATEGVYHAVEPARQPEKAGAVAVLPLVGPITQRGGGLFELFFGGTSTERFTRSLRQALGDSSIGAVVIDVDSPGGTVNGVDELSTEIFRARGSKPIVALANGMAASAAYWVASAADRLLVTPSGEVGSIGVWAAHVDVSEMLSEMGQHVTLISAGKYKVEGNPYEPLGDEARDYMQSRVDEYYNLFTRAVARNRGAGVEAVRGGYGEGRVVGAAQAVKAGMADGVATFDEAIMQAAKLARQQQRARAEQAFRLGAAGL